MCMYAVPVPSVTTEVDGSNLFASDKLTLLAQITNRMKPLKVRDGSVPKQYVLKYMFTQYSSPQGLRAFPHEGQNTLDAKFQQLDHKEVFAPIMWDDLTWQEKFQIWNVIILFEQKYYGRIKAHACTDGQEQRSLFTILNTTSHIIKTELVMLSRLVGFLEYYKVVIFDLTGAFFMHDLIRMRLSTCN